MKVFSTLLELATAPLMLVTDAVDKMMGTAPEDYLSYQLQTDPKILGLSAFRGNVKGIGLIEPGMVLRVKRTFYRHYGVYVGNGEVIHFTSDDGDRSKNNIIQKTSLRRFIGASEVVDVLSFPQMIDGRIVFSREETVKNAISHLGDGGYDVIKNNCQHFAIWCRTGVKFSGQSYYVGGASFSGTLPHAPDFLSAKGISVSRTILAPQVVAG